MNKAGPPKFRQPDLAVSTKAPPDARAKYTAYLARGNWRCEKSPTGAHHVLEDVCVHCGEYRGKG